MKWEDICSRCSLCCYEKAVLDDYVLIDLASPCIHLDGSTGLCSVYEDRFRVCRRCMKVTLLRAMTASYMPPSCAYVEWAKRHHIRFCREREMVLSRE